MTYRAVRVMGLILEWLKLTKGFQKREREKEGNLFSVGVYCKFEATVKRADRNTGVKAWRSEDSTTGLKTK